MSATIAIEIPREIIHVTKMTGWEFQQLLGSKGIPIHNGV
jgi:hypothetical protein